MSDEKKNTGAENALLFQAFFKGEGGDLALKQIDCLTGYGKNESLWSPDPYKHAFNAGMHNVSVQIHKLLEAKIERTKKDE